MIKSNRLELLKYNPDLITRDEVIDLITGREKTRTRFAVGLSVTAELIAYIILGCVLLVFTVWPLAALVTGAFVCRMIARLIRMNKEGQI